LSFGIFFVDGHSTRRWRVRIHSILLWHWNRHFQLHRRLSGHFEKCQSMQPTLSTKDSFLGSTFYCLSNYVAPVA
jgi:hypothetical protein